MSSDEDKWVTTCDRYIAYFDIAGFKNRLGKEGFEATNTILNNIYEFTSAATSKLKLIKSVTFSDSILLISHSDSKDSASQIINASKHLLKFGGRDNTNTPTINSKLNPFAMRGVLTHGKFKADFDKSIYFGEPLINAYLLEQQMQFFGAIADTTFTEKTKTYYVKPGTINMFPINAEFLKETKFDFLNLKYSYSSKKEVQFLDFLDAIKMDSRFTTVNPLVEVGDESKELLKTIYKTLNTPKSKKYALNTFKYYNLTPDEIKIIENN